MISQAGGQLNGKFYFVNSFLFAFIFSIIIFFFSIEDFTTVVCILTILIGFLSFFEPLWGLALVLITSFFIEGQLLYKFVLFNFLGFNWYLMELAFIVSFLGLSFRYLAGFYKIKNNYISYSIFLFVLIGIWGVYWGMHNANSFQKIFFDFRAFFYYLAFIPALVILEEKKKLKLFFVLLLLLGTLKSVIDIYYSVFIIPKSYDFEIREYLPFARLTGANEITYPLTLLGGLIYFFIRKKLTTRLFLIPVIAFSSIAMFLSYTRGSWLAVFLSLLLFVFLLIVTKQIRINLPLVIISSIFLALVVFVFDFIGIVNIAPFINRATSISLNRIDISNLGRMVEYATALQAFMTNPVWGKGLGFMFTYFAPGIGSISTEYCHNTYIYILSKMGLFGLLPFLAVLILSISQSFFLVKKIRENDEYLILFIMCMLLFCISIKSFTTWHLNSVTFSMFVGILFGGAVLARNMRKIS